MNAETNTCAFCRNETTVLRQYLHAKNKPVVGNGFTYIYYCGKCGLEEDIDGKKQLDILKGEILPKVQKFIDKVESGRARSVETYEDMKQIRDLFKTNQE